MAENNAVAKRLANRCGYWYFPKYAVLRDTLRKPSDHNYLQMTWKNHGVAPVYHRYDARLHRLHKQSGKLAVFELGESNNHKWMPGRIVGEYYKLHLPDDLLPGKYNISVGLFDHCRRENTPIRLAIHPARRNKERRLL
ncbi:MAG: DUF4832 domain-containing protein [Chryseosolibacter sp.]